MKYLRYILFVLVIIPFMGMTQAPFTLNSHTEIVHVKHVNYLIDTNKDIAFSDISTGSAKFSTDGKYYQLQDDIVTWVKLDLVIGIENLALLIDQANLDTVELYQIDKLGNWSVTKYGNNYNFNHRKYKLNHFVFDINTTKTNSTVYLKVRNHVATTFNILLGEQTAILERENSTNLLFFFLLGVIFAIIAYNLFLYLSLRENIYLVYVVSSGITAVLQMILFGSSFQYLWPNYVDFQNFAPEFVTTIGTIAGLIFMKMFLKTKNNTPNYDKIANVFIGFYGLLLVVVWFDLILVNRLLLIFQPLLAIFILVTAVVITLKGFEPAKFYLRAWSIFLIGIIAYVLAEKGVIPRNNFTTLSLTFGAAFEVIFLSFALANRINILKADQEKAIANSLRLEKEKANLIIEQNIELEDKVHVRTNELELANAGLADTNKELSIAYTHLKNTQSQLVHAEKMSSLGQLTAGIAHEINNPINFVSSNILPLKRDVEDLIAIFTQTKEYAKEKLSEEDYQFISDLKEQYDYEYILQEIDQLLEGMNDGANRTVEIIRGLKLFSRVDEDDLKRVNLEDGIDSTLILLNSSIKHHVAIEKKYEGIPEVECYGGKMNQVFMNIISNAVQAIKSTDSEDGKVTITTQKAKESVTISIADNGPGMTEEVKVKLFEPFFTTKPVGEGTGLGLSIVYKIIDKIDGKIVVNTEPGKGTEFVITLPINNKSTD